MHAEDIAATCSIARVFLGFMLNAESLATQSRTFSGG